MNNQKIIEILEQHGLPEAAGYMRRLEGVEGPERSLVAPAAERAERQGAVEDSREGRRVAPVKAKADEQPENLSESLLRLERDVWEALRRTDWPTDLLWRVVRGAGEILSAACAAMPASQPKPESGADAGESTPSENPPPKPTREP